MQDGMKGNPEESLRSALAEFAEETGASLASDRVRQRLHREVQRRVYRRWAFAALAAAVALSAIFFGVTTRLIPPRIVAQVGRTSRNSSAPAPAVVTTPAPKLDPARESAVGVGPNRVGDPSVAVAASVPVSPKRAHDSRQPRASGNWRRGEIVLSPWYYNTALPPSARSVLVRSEVDARTAMRFGVVSASDTTPVEILFGEDGLPRAMRFVHHLPTQSN